MYLVSTLHTHSKCIISYKFVLDSSCTYVFKLCYLVLAIFIAKDIYMNYYRLGMHIRVFFHAGVTITNDPLPFMVDQDAVLTCYSDTGVVDRIQWVSRGGVVLAGDTLVQQLQLMLKPVNDCPSVHTSNFFWSVTRDEERLNQTISNQTLPVTVKSTGLFSLFHTYMCLQTLTNSLLALGDLHLQPSHQSHPLKLTHSRRLPGRISISNVIVLYNFSLQLLCSYLLFNSV